MKPQQELKDKATELINQLGGFTLREKYIIVKSFYLSFMDVLDECKITEVELFTNPKFDKLPKD